MKTLADIRSGVTKKAKGEEARHIPKVRQTKEGQRVLITDHEVEVSKKTNKLKEVAEEKRTEITSLDDEFEQKKKAALSSLDTIVQEAEGQAKQILADAKEELSQAIAIQKQMESEQEVLNQREQDQNTVTEKQNQREEQLDARTLKITKSEDDMAKKKSAAVNAYEQSLDLLTTLAAVVQAGIARVEALGRLSQSAEIDLSGVVAKLSDMSALLAEKEQELSAKEEAQDRREEQLDEKQAILKEQRTQLNMALQDPSVKNKV